jgi:hypothetical protein
MDSATVYTIFLGDEQSFYKFNSDPDYALGVALAMWRTHSEPLNVSCKPPIAVYNNMNETGINQEIIDKYLVTSNKSLVKETSAAACELSKELTSDKSSGDVKESGTIGESTDDLKPSSDSLKSSDDSLKSSGDSLKSSDDYVVDYRDPDCGSATFRMPSRVLMGFYYGIAILRRRKEGLKIFKNGKLLANYPRGETS